MFKNFPKSETLFLTVQILQLIIILTSRHTTYFIKYTQVNKGEKVT